VEEALEKVIVTLKIFNHFRTAFKDSKQTLPNHFKGEKKPKTWEFQEHLVRTENFKIITKWTGIFYEGKMPN